MAPANAQAKKKRIILTFLDKSRIIKRIRQGESKTDIANHYGTSLPCIYAINRNKENIVKYLGKLAAEEIHLRRNENPARQIFKQKLANIRSRMEAHQQPTHDGWVSAETEASYAAQLREIEKIRKEMSKKDPAFYEKYFEGEDSKETSDDDDDAQE